ncbi:AAA family ATPase [Vibrio owensii]|uniref:AAA family ATPase n=1 Tax=Vibrio owensii TaxID=696485 RepID=UPI004068A47D
MDNNANAEVIELPEAKVEVDYTEMKTVYLRDVFSPYIPKNVDLQIEIPKHRHPDVPADIFNYNPDLQTLKDMLSWFLAPQRTNFIHFVGPTGSGKTDFQLWFANRMNWPIVLVTVNESLQPEKMMGRWILRDGTTTFVLGPVADAMKNGKMLIMDELDKASLNFIAKMHLPAEMTKPWTLEDTGEVIIPARNYRFCSTGNTNGQGDFSGLYPSSKRWDTAFRNRALVLNVGYLESSQEYEVITTKYPQFKSFPKSVRLMIKYANAMRDAMLGPDRDGAVEDGITTSFSTRVLLAWCNFICAQGLSVPLRKSFNAVFFNGIDNDDRDDIVRIIDQVFRSPKGHFLDNGLGWLDGVDPSAKKPQTANSNVGPASDLTCDLGKMKFALYLSPSPSGGKYWGIFVDSTSLHRVYGAANSKKLRYHKSIMSSPSEALNEARKLISEKEKKGYEYKKTRTFSRNEIEDKSEVPTTDLAGHSCWDDLENDITLPTRSLDIANEATEVVLRGTKTSVDITIDDECIEDRKYRQRLADFSTLNIISK